MEQPQGKQALYPDGQAQGFCGCTEGSCSGGVGWAQGGHATEAVLVSEGLSWAKRAPQCARTKPKRNCRWAKEVGEQGVKAGDFSKLPVVSSLHGWPGLAVVCRGSPCYLVMVAPLRGILLPGVE